MKNIITIVGFVWISLISCNTATAKEWRGIEPLRSTKVDVGRLLGSPTKNTLNAYFYDLKDEHVFIQFSANSCEESQLEAWKVPPDTVVSVLVAPKMVQPVKDLTIDAKYDIRVDGVWKSHRFYSDVENGEIIETNNGIVMSVTYRPAAKYGHLLCFNSVEEWMKAVGIGCILPVKLDEYGDIPTGDENARLDNFAIQLKGDQGRAGYIRVYGSTGRSSKIQGKADRAKKYLINKLGIKAWRILTTTDYSRDELGVELWIWPLGQFAPE